MMRDTRAIDRPRPESVADAEVGETYFPPPESQGGWRHLQESSDIHDVAGLDPEKLDRIAESQLLLHSAYRWSIVVVRPGHLVREYHTPLVSPTTRFDVWSCTKSFTGTAWGLLLDDSRRGHTPGGQTVALDSAAYEFIPHGHPLTDPRKGQITVGHLLSMTSGLPGEDHGLFATTVATDHGAFEDALGRCPNRDGRWCDRLVAKPGTHWDYSDPAFVHLSLALRWPTICTSACLIPWGSRQPVGSLWVAEAPSVRTRRRTQDCTSRRARWHASAT